MNETVRQDEHEQSIVYCAAVDGFASRDQTLFVIKV